MNIIRVSALEYKNNMITVYCKFESMNKIRVYLKFASVTYI